MKDGQQHDEDLQLLDGRTIHVTERIDHFVLRRYSMVPSIYYNCQMRWRTIRLNCDPPSESKLGNQRSDGQVLAGRGHNCKHHPRPTGQARQSRAHDAVHLLPNLNGEPI